ncbi:U32 family peptidase [[Clostridium] polysaccharolyticum]|uniref:Putative protease n=1 Tax=[Clostridium] polysaccharolyticum TaxID=29364 RepID=A0A1I0B4Y6_9FIRM|nr:U32 family peptidase [[Clostridium] polysaccharolyticum]SET01164.1 putative protease [[Clostridium] polysaccharolyticum]
MTRKIEILAPAGSMEGLVAAIQGGCDAVYIGGQKFGARAYANNLDQKDMIWAIEYAHLHHKKLYLTINTLVKESEFGALYDYLLPFYIHGLDAVIVQDFGVLSYVSRTFPGMEIHASTQMTLTMAQGASQLKEYGVTRLVASRELQFDEVKEIRNNTDLEIEAFVHGALCYSFSGQCLMSSMIGGRSGNRGRCAQPCRMQYHMEEMNGESYKGKQEFLLSPKDMCTIYDIPELVESGIDSFKIEGRMKRPEYAAMTAHLYRKYVDLYQQMGAQAYKTHMKKHPELLENDRKHLMDLYNRGGFSEGYYRQHNGKTLMSMDRPNHSGVLVGTVKAVRKNRAAITLSDTIFAQDVLEIRSDKGENVYDFTVKDKVEKGIPYEANFKPGSKVKIGQKVYRTKNQSLLTDIQEKIIKRDNREPVQAYFFGKANEPVMLTLTYGDITVTAIGETAQVAKNQPIGKEKIRKQLDKTKDTPFYLESVQIDSAEDWFMPLGKLNEFRRNAFEQLEQEFQNSFLRESVPRTKVHLESALKKKREPDMTVGVMNREQLEIAVKEDSVSRVLLHFSMIEQEPEILDSDLSDKQKEFYIVLPTVFRHKTYMQYKKKTHPIYQAASHKNIDGFVVKNLEELEYLKEEGCEKEKLLDYNLYMMNKETQYFWENRGITQFTASLELNHQELKELNIEGYSMIVYGYTPLMTSAQCVVKNTRGCTSKSGYFCFADKSGNPFYGKNFCTCCYNVIYNGKPLHLIEHLEDIKNLGVSDVRLDFTMESGKEMERVLSCYTSYLRGKKEKSNCVENYTKGHFKRGIE